MNSANFKKSLIGLSLGLASSIVFASQDANNILETFESASIGSLADASLSAWSGEGAIVATENGVAQTQNPKLINTTATKHLSVEGEVVCASAATENKNASQIDFLFNVSEAGDDTPSVEGLEEAQVAVAIGANTTSAEDCTSVKLYLYCTSGDVGWKEVSSVTKSSWARINLIMDYANGKCLMLLNGTPVVSSYGYATADAENVSSGAWYKFASTVATSAKVQSLKFAGVANIDDVIISQDALNEYAAFTEDAVEATEIAGKTIPVSKNDLIKLGVTAVSESTLAIDDSGYTYIEKVEAGYQVDDGKTLAPSDMVLKMEGVNQVLKLTVPAPTRAAAPKYTIQLVNGVTSDNYGEPIVATSATNGELTFTMPKGEDMPKILKIKLSATINN